MSDQNGFDLYRAEVFDFERGQWETVDESPDAEQVRNFAKKKAELGIPARVLAIAIERFPAYPVEKKKK